MLNWERSYLVHVYRSVPNWNKLAQNSTPVSETRNSCLNAPPPGPIVAPFCWEVSWMPLNWRAVKHDHCLVSVRSDAHSRQ